MVGDAQTGRDAAEPEHAPFTVFRSARDIASRAALLLEALCAEAVQKRGSFTLALSGGKTPDMLFSLLAEPEWRRRINWPATHVFWGDERCVPPDDNASNYKRARDLLLSKVMPATVCRIKGELRPRAAARDYEKRLRRHSPLFTPEDAGAMRALPRFDCILLGMGKDGHTASIFPGESAAHETHRTAVAQYVAALESWRVTLTLPVLNNARACVFIVTGTDKKHMLQKIADQAGDAVPAQQVRPVAGQLYWFVDAEAAPLHCGSVTCNPMNGRKRDA